MRIQQNPNFWSHCPRLFESEIHHKMPFFVWRQYPTARISVNTLSVHPAVPETSNHETFRYTVNNGSKCYPLLSIYIYIYICVYGPPPKNRYLLMTRTGTCSIFCICSSIAHKPQTCENEINRINYQRATNDMLHRMRKVQKNVKQCKTTKTLM